MRRSTHLPLTKHLCPQRTARPLPQHSLSLHATALSLHAKHGDARVSVRGGARRDAADRVGAVPGGG
eukprot:2886359-Rhodomonas_salina.1